MNRFKLIGALCTLAALWYLSVFMGSTEEHNVSPLFKASLENSIAKMEGRIIDVSKNNCAFSQKIDLRSDSTYTMHEIYATCSLNPGDSSCYSVALGCPSTLGNVITCSYYHTCNTEATCSGYNTCGQSTCSTNYTCEGYYTCQSYTCTEITCSLYPTCQDTCDRYRKARRGPSPNDAQY